MALDKTDAARLDWILSCAGDAEEKLSEWENEFIDDLTERREQYGDAMNVSDKMWDVLERIHEKAPL